MIYAIEAVGTRFVKIGITGRESVDNRLSNLQTASPHELRVIATAKWADSDEGRIHRYLHRDRVRGEWFDMSERTISVVEWMKIGDRTAFIEAFFSNSGHRRLGKMLDLCRDIATQQDFKLCRAQRYRENTRV